MSMTISERRKKDRERKARQRARLRAARAPTPAAAQNAVAEAVAFAIAGVNIADIQSGNAMISVETVVRTSRRILIDRMRYDRDLSKAAVAKLLRPRPEHGWPGHTPTHADPIRRVS